MTSVQLHTEDKVGREIEKIVQEYNEYNPDHPIVIFQFVSLDNSTNKNLIWWSYDYNSLSNLYTKTVTAFIGEKKIKRTLVNWEYDKGAYRYAVLGDGKIITNIKKKNYISGKKPDVLDLGINFINSEAPDVLLQRWEYLLQQTFVNGSTMWVSIPHKDNRNEIIYSSVFVVFNSKLPESFGEPDKRILLDTYRLFRNFIVQYLIDFYKAPVIEQLKLAKKTLTTLNRQPKDEEVLINNTLISEIIEKLKKYSAIDKPILLLGQKGTGKSFYAEKIIATERGHTNTNKKYFELNCARFATNPETAYSELFGSDTGAFTGAIKKSGIFETYSNGTVFLDEVHMLPLQCQIMLNVFLEKKHFSRMGSDVMITSDVKLIFASNLPLENLKEVLSPDFFGRIKTIRITLPALTELGEGEIQRTAEYLLKQICGNNRFIPFSDLSIQKIRNYTYPENFRELKNCIESAYVLADLDNASSITPKYLLFDDDIGVPGSNFIVKIDSEDKDYIALKKIIENIFKASGGHPIKGSDLMKSPFMRGFGSTTNSAYTNLKKQLTGKMAVLLELIEMNPNLPIAELPAVSTVLKNKIP